METLRLKRLVTNWYEAVGSFVVSDGEWEEIKSVVSELEGEGMIETVSSGSGEKSIVVPSPYTPIVSNLCYALLGEPQH